MKFYSFLVFTCLFSQVNWSQNSENDQIKEVIIEFFEAFHKQDTIKLKAMANGNIIIHSISENKLGESHINSENYKDFLKSIASIPETSTFKEKVLDYTINIDGNMAHVWTPYAFWYNKKFSHCGVNSFQLAKLDTTWKLIYLADTRRKTGCK